MIIKLKSYRALAALRVRELLANDVLRGPLTVLPVLRSLDEYAMRWHTDEGGGGRAINLYRHQHFYDDRGGHILIF